MEGDPLIFSVLLQIILVALNAIFACAEIAVISANDAKLEKMASEGDKRAGKLIKLTAIPARFLATIQVAITLSGFLGSAFAADNFADLLISGFGAIGIPMARSVAVILITVILSYITLVFGELVPKRLAMKQPERLSLGMANLLYGVSVAFAPLVSLLTASTNAMLRLLHIDPNEDGDAVTEEEIRMMVDVGNEKGTIDADEKEMIQAVFEFDDISADEICTHRTDVDVLYMEDSLEEWERTIHECRHSLFPVCGESVDDIIGILDAKDYFRLDECSREVILAQAIHPAWFVPETIRADLLFSKMKKTGNYFAVVLDEYGGMTGIITVRDLVEQLVGDLDGEDEEDRTPDIEKLAENRWSIQGGASLDDVEEELGLTLPKEDYDTFGGYIFSILGEIPEDGSEFDVMTERMHIHVQEVREHRVEKTVVELFPEEKQEEDG